MIARALVLAVAMTLPTAAALVYFVGMESPSGAKASVAMQATYAGSKVVQFALPVLWFVLWGNLPLAAWKPTRKGLALGLGFGLAVGGAMLGIYYGFLRDHPLLQHTPEKLRAKVTGLGCNEPMAFLALAVFLSTLHSLGEEYYWRWFVFGELRPWMPHGLAIFVGGLAFMAHHVVILTVYFPGRFWLAALFSLGVAIGGWFWNWLYDRTGSVYPGWVGHALIDGAIMVIGFDLIFVHLPTVIH